MKKTTSTRSGNRQRIILMKSAERALSSHVTIFKPNKAVMPIYHHGC